MNVADFSKDHSAVNMFDARNGHDDGIVKSHDFRHLSLNFINSAIQ